MTQHIDNRPRHATDDTAKRRRRSRMIRAILAGGLVLGVGAAVTLAAWNDSEYVTGTFTAGTFNLQGSTTDGTTFTDHPVGSPGTLTFTVAPLLLSPGDTVYAPFAVRLAANTTNNANVVITAPNATTGDRHQPHLRGRADHRVHVRLRHRRLDRHRR